MDNDVTLLGRLIVTSLAHCDVTKKLSHAQAGINRSQTPGAYLGHPGVRDKSISDTRRLSRKPGVRDKTVSRPS